MHVAILRRVPHFSVSMDVYADGLVGGLHSVRSDWTISEHCPQIFGKSALLSPFNGMGKYYERYWRYPNFLERLDADIFHIVDHSDGYLSAKLSRSHRPSVVTCHDLINLIQPETFKGRAKFPMLSMTLWKQAVRSMRQADHVITVSVHTKKDTVEQLGISPEDVTVIPNAVDRSFKRLTPEQIRVVRERYGLTADSFCLLNIGSNNARKNISAILAVVEVLKRRGLPVHFWKAGADFNSAQKQFIQERKLSGAVRYLGKPNGIALIELYNAANCLMAPSLYEGFGLTILEAMACGTPVITANVSAMPEVAGNAAVLVDPTDIQAMAEAVCYVYRHPDEAKMLAAKGQIRAQKFTWENTAEQVAQVYEKTLSKISKPYSK